MSGVDEKALAKQGLTMVSEMLTDAALPGGPVTGEILQGLLAWGREAIDAHDTPEAARDAIRAALSTYGADAARNKFG